MKGMALSVLLLIDSRPRPSALKLIERCQREQLIGISQGLLSFWPEATQSLRNKYSRRTMPSARKEQNVLAFSRPLLFPIPGQSPVSISQTPHIYFRVQFDNTMTSPVFRPPKTVLPHNYEKTHTSHPAHLDPRNAMTHLFEEPTLAFFFWLRSDRALGTLACNCKQTRALFTLGHVG